MKKQTQKVKYQTIGKRLAEHYGYTPVDVTRNPGNKGYTLPAKDGDTMHEIDFDTFRDRVIVLRDFHYQPVQEPITLNETPEIVDVNLYPDDTDTADNGEQ